MIINIKLLIMLVALALLLGVFYHNDTTIKMVELSSDENITDPHNIQK